MVQHHPMEANGSNNALQSGFITAAQFLEDMRREARFYRLPRVEDALAKILEEIERSAVLAQARLLTRILVALGQKEGTFRQADLTLLSVATLGLVDSLLEGHAAGLVSQGDCARAADRAMLAQRAAEA